MNKRLVVMLMVAFLGETCSAQEPVFSARQPIVVPGTIQEISSLAMADSNFSIQGGSMQDTNMDDRQPDLASSLVAGRFSEEELLRLHNQIRASGDTNEVLKLLKRIACLVANNPSEIPTLLSQFLRNLVPEYAECVLDAVVNPTRGGFAHAFCTIIEGTPSICEDVRIREAVTHIFMGPNAAKFLNNLTPVITTNLNLYPNFISQLSEVFDHVLPKLFIQIFKTFISLNFTNFCRFCITFCPPESDIQKAAYQALLQWELETGINDEAIEWIKMQESNQKKLIEEILSANGVKPEKIQERLHPHPYLNMGYTLERACELLAEARKEDAQSATYQLEDKIGRPTSF